MLKTCTNPWCLQPFDITDSDLQFYEKVSPIFKRKKELIPPPTQCPDCRLQRRLAWRNERHLHKGVCGLCKQAMISAFPPDSGYTVYCPDCWWSDKWNPTDYGREIDFSRPFFEQFSELLRDVPKAAALQLNNENSKYNILLAFSKNAYLCPGSYCVEDCFYLRKSQYCRDCADSSNLNKCELVADSTDCDTCNASHHLINCRNCSSTSYLSDCSNVRNSFMCSGLREKQYAFKNRQLSQEEYAKVLSAYADKHPDEIMHEFQAFNSTIPKRAQIQINCDGSRGDYLYNCKNALDCFGCFNVVDSKYLLECEDVKDSMDFSMHDKEIQLCYEMCSGGEKNYQTAFSYCTIAAPRSLYLYSCFYLSDSFGCDGFHARGQHCILNRQYSKEEYEEVLPRLIDHMRKADEWGEFPPVRISPYSYNFSSSQDHFPLKKEEAVSRGWKWKDEVDEAPKVARTIPASQLPLSIADIPDDIVNWAIQCEVTNRPFRIIKQELDFYRKMKLPVPRLHPDERNRRRLALKNPRKLWDRTCGKCGKGIVTSYAEGRPERVYCEFCYLQGVY